MVLLDLAMLYLCTYYVPSSLDFASETVYVYRTKFSAPGSGVFVRVMSVACANICQLLID